jgi:aspartokinase/homoserine dehydrogenase 1
MKFGGSCLKDARSYYNTTEIIKNYLGKSKLVIVASAMNSITDKLIDFYKKSCNEDLECEVILDEINTIHWDLINNLIESKTLEYEKSITFLKENIEELTQLGYVIRLIRPSKDIQDLIISYGEKLSTYILTQYLNSIGIDSEYVPSNDIIITDDNFGNALPLLDDTEVSIVERLVPTLNSEPNPTLCVTGFFGSTKDDKKITTLGRGGTDLTAAVLAYGLRKLKN